jgi:hypothetical protein
MEVKIMEKVNIAVNYELNIPTDCEDIPIRDLVIQCPECSNWFHQSDVCDEFIRWDCELYFAECRCPICHTKFDLRNVKEDPNTNPSKF